MDTPPRTFREAGTPLHARSADPCSPLRSRGSLATLESYPLVQSAFTPAQPARMRGRQTKRVIYPFSQV
jgi:hypothetical protein